MEWAALIAAGLFEMLGVNAINRFNEKKSAANLFGLIIFFLCSFLLLSYAITKLSMSTAYAIWTGIGAAGGAILGIIYHGESKDLKRLFFISLIIIATIGLKIIS
ncbi:DMT family transporter [Vagococcus vulneris]|uniref:QacE family quaternary ammonium compound efflux SMR transporter n=1 Tax=Vagococcus vulneris TaxID=1977869 RepID=A0A430A296_9ENTE|nr:SMR family transporter [Vagococcus vulneris]RSU00574.1 QacE family quaternary ammonium compound efflux SMR transporter [Vagococcus vulneris]